MQSLVLLYCGVKGNPHSLIQSANPHPLLLSVSRWWSMQTGCKTDLTTLADMFQQGSKELTSFIRCCQHPLSGKHPFGNHSFSYAAPSAWNSLPREKIHSLIQSTIAFKTALKTHLFQSYYHWQTLYSLHFPLLTVFVDFLRCVHSVCVCVCDEGCLPLGSLSVNLVVLEGRALQVFHYYHY